MSKMLFVVPSLARAGAETQLVELINGLSGSDFKKHLFAFEKNLDLLPRVDGQNVAFHHNLRRSKYDLSASGAIARLIDSAAIDVVHCSLQIALLMGWLGLMRARRQPRLILALHTTLNRNRKAEWFDRAVYQWLMRRCTLVICVCEAQQTHWHKKFPFLRNRTRVIYNGVDTRYYEPRGFVNAATELRRGLGIPYGAVVFCHVAAFRPEKGHCILVEAFAHLLREDAAAYLLFAGDGVLRAEIEQQVEQLGIAANVRFLGSVADVRPLLAASECAVIPSTAETFSMAMLEAMAMELPVVATDVGGTCEAVLNGRTGLLIPPKDTQALTRALREMLLAADARQSMGAAARRLVEHRFTRDAMVRKTQALLESVV